MHLLENTSYSNNMFEGYNGRRRLKTLIALLLGIVVLAVLINRQSGKIFINLIFTKK